MAAVSRTATWALEKITGLDFYRTVLYHSDPRLQVVSRVKSWVFVALYALFCLVLITYYVTTPQTRVVTILKPSLQDVNNLMEHWAPTCQCGTAMTGAHAVNFALPTAMNYVSGNQCAGIMHVMNLATDPDTRLTGLPFVGTSGAPNASVEQLHAALALKFLMQPMHRMCIQMATAVSDALQEIGQIALGSTMLSEPALSDRMFRTASAAFRNVAVTGDTLQLSLETLAVANVLAFTDTSLSAMTRTPENCSCDLRYFTTLNTSVMIGSPCLFRPAYDSVTSRDTWYTCSIAQNTLWFPLDLLQGQQLPEHFNVSNLVRMPAVPLTYEVFFHLLVYPVYDFVLATSGRISNKPDTWLRAGIMKTDYKQYYDNCMPSSCSYIVTAPISGIDVLVTLFGICGGAMTMIFHLVNVAGTICAKRVLKLDLPADEDSALHRTKSGRTKLGNMTVRRIGTTRTQVAPSADDSWYGPPSANSGPGDTARVGADEEVFSYNPDGPSTAGITPREVHVSADTPRQSFDDAALDSPVRRMKLAQRDVIAADRRIAVEVEDLDAGTAPAEPVSTSTPAGAVGVDPDVPRHPSDTPSDAATRNPLMVPSVSFYAPTAVSARGPAPHKFEPSHAMPRTQQPRSILRGSSQHTMSAGADAAVTAAHAATGNTLGIVAEDPSSLCAHTLPPVLEMPHDDARAAEDAGTASPASSVHMVAGSSAAVSPLLLNAGAHPPGAFLPSVPSTRDSSR